MEKILKFDPIEDCIRDVLSVLEKENFEEVVWVGMHGWIRCIARAIWLRGYKFEKLLTNTQARWGQEHDDIDGHKFTCVPFDAAREIGDRAVYIMANTHRDTLTDQLASLGCSPERVFVLPLGKYYWKNSSKQMMKSYGSNFELISHREVQAALLNLLCEFRKICDQNGLAYFLEGGTLIGAVRHHGFVPWDADVDVSMPVEDYKKLKALYPSGGRYELVSITDYPELGRWFPLFYDNNFPSYNPYYGITTPLHIDIFPILGCGNSLREAIQRKKEMVEGTEEFRIHSHTRAFDKINRFPELMKKILEPIPNSRLLTIPSFLPSDALYKMECYQNYVEATFEGETFHVPCRYEEVLFTQYGTYTVQPPVEYRGGRMDFFKKRGTAYT